jgi:hypothetical protein
MCLFYEVSNPIEFKAMFFFLFPIVVELAPIF